MQAAYRVISVAIGFVVALCLLELVVRLATQTLFLPIGSRTFVRDPIVGRLSKAGTRLRDPFHGCTTSIGENGTRNNSNPPVAQRPLTLAVGDSFTFGEDVGDSDSWPAALERISGRRVINAGVPGFGFDQSVLRAEQLTPLYLPDVIVVGFIWHDVHRCEMSCYLGRLKPYFELTDSGVQLHLPELPSPSALTPLKELLSHSMVANMVLDHFLNWDGPVEKRVHDQGPEVACRLMQRLAALGADQKRHIVVLAQPHLSSLPQYEIDVKDRMLTCAQANHLATLDLFPVFARIPPDERGRLFGGHMTREGNELVAAQLARFIEHEPLGVGQ